MVFGLQTLILGHSVIITCALCFRCAELLLDGGAEVDVRVRESRLTPLHVVARRGLEEHVELFLSHRADVLVTNREGETPLNAACSGAERPSDSGRYLRVIQMLLDAGADPRTAGRKQHTPLHNACANCCSRIVEVLLQHGAKPNVENCAGFTPMDCLLQVAEEGEKSKLVFERWPYIKIRQWNEHSCSCSLRWGRLLGPAARRSGSIPSQPRSQDRFTQVPIITHTDYTNMHNIYENIGKLSNPPISS